MYWLPKKNPILLTFNCKRYCPACQWSDGDNNLFLQVFDYDATHYFGLWSLGPWRLILYEWYHAWHTIHIANDSENEQIKENWMLWFGKRKDGLTIVCNGRSARFQRLCEHLMNVETHDGDQICVGEMVFYNCKTFHGGYKSPICGWNRVSRAFRENILSFLLIGDTSVKQSEVRSACSFCVSPLHRASRAFIRHHTIDTEAFICCLCP